MHMRARAHSQVVLAKNYWAIAHMLISCVCVCLCHCNSTLRSFELRITRLSNNNICLLASYRKNDDFMLHKKYFKFLFCFFSSLRLLSFQCARFVGSLSFGLVYLLHWINSVFFLLSTNEFCGSCIRLPMSCVVYLNPFTLFT